MIGADDHEVIRRYRRSPAYPIAGEPFGFGVSKFKGDIFRKALARGMSQAEAFWHSERAYERAMKYVPTFRHFQEALACVNKSQPFSSRFTKEELKAIAERFSMANDDLGQSIAAKANLMLDKAD